jgi:hypothetical protein
MTHVLCGIALAVAAVRAAGCGSAPRATAGLRPAAPSSPTARPRHSASGSTSAAQIAVGRSELHRAITHSALSRSADQPGKAARKGAMRVRWLASRRMSLEGTPLAWFDRN